MASSTEITLRNGVLSFAELTASAKTDAQIWCIEKLWRVPLILDEGGKQTTLWIRRSALTKRWKVTPQQISAAQTQGGIAALAQIVNDLEIQRISTLLQKNTLALPDRTKAAETLSSALREARKNQTELFLPASGELPYDAYVNRDGSVYFKIERIAPCILGEVWKCEKLGSAHPVVVKDVQVDPYCSQPYRELDNLRKLQGGPNIIPLIAANCYTNQKGYPRMAIFMPQYRGSLDKMKRKLTGAQKEIVAKKIIRTLSYLAEKGIYRDFALKNILIDPITLDIKFIDFGTFVFHGEDESFIQDRIGTPSYFSPEYAAAKASEIPKVTTPKVDVWACGIALLELFEIIDPAEVVPSSPEKGWLYSLKGELASIPLPFLKLIHRMTHPQPDKRCTAYKAHATLSPKIKISAQHLTLPWMFGHLRYR